ncbi:MAG: phosphatidic acid phosphatase [Lachnospiraceae bacterium]|nr:phosphatidic acid phosphatase [Lachnospiraceae bacterium]
MKTANIVPRYSWFPLILVAIFNFIAYNGSRVFSTGLHHYDISTALDNSLPFVSWFVIFYVLAYVQWIAGYIIIGRESKELCYRVISAEFFAKVICMICFIVFPTTLDRPQIDGNGLFDMITSFIYSLDAPDNLFPSIHCLESWFCFRGAMYTNKMPGWYKWVMLFVAIGVFASTVLIKQHVLYDIIGAVVLVEIALFLSKKLHFGRMFEYINGKLGL